MQIYVTYINKPNFFKKKFKKLLISGNNRTRTYDFSV